MGFIIIGFGILLMLLSVFMEDVLDVVIFGIGFILFFVGTLLGIDNKNEIKNIKCINKTDSTIIETYNNCVFEGNAIVCKDYRTTIPQNYKCLIEKQMEKN